LGAACIRTAEETDGAEQRAQHDLREFVRDDPLGNRGVLRGIIFETAIEENNEPASPKPSEVPFTDGSSLGFAAMICAARGIRRNAAPPGFRATISSPEMTALTAADASNPPSGISDTTLSFEPARGAGHTGRPTGAGLLTWIYVASIILLYGAEFCRVYAERFGSLARKGSGGASVGAPVESRVDRRGAVDRLGGL
jgi:hypothetical protein